MAPYKEKLDNCKYKLPDLRSRIHNRIRIIKQRLTEMTSPVQSPAQEYVYGEYIERIQELTQEANIDISDIEANHRKAIFLTELKDLKTDMHNIECETSAIATYAHGKHPTPGPQPKPARSMQLLWRPNIQP